MLVFLMTVSSVQSSPITSDSDLSTDPSTATLMVDMNMMVQLLDLENDFSNMMTCTRKDLDGCKTEEVQFHLNNLFDVEEFSKCYNIGLVLRKLCRDHIDTFNIRYLKCLVSQFHRNDAILKIIEEYEAKKEEFLKATTVKEFQQAVLSRAEALISKGMATIVVTVPEKYGNPRTMKDVEALAEKGILDRHRDLVRINVVPGKWSLFSKEEQVVLKSLQQKGENY